MPEQRQFNPFTDRLSRDIRNGLSTALLRSIRQGTVEPAEECALRFLAATPERVYVEYIENRLRLYRRAVETIAGKIEDPFRRAFVLWDLELFFELHEVLEQEWYHAKGDTRLLMQALIRAAGVYIKREYEFEQAARKIAAKSLAVLEQQREVLAGYFPPEKLIEPLRAGSPVPPKLLSGK